jgi:hypothetical protein
MSSHHEQEHGEREVNLIWILPPLLVLFIVVMCVFMWRSAGNNTDQVMDTWHQDFVPAETPHSTGTDSR